MRTGHRSLLWLAVFGLAAAACSSSDQPAICNSLTDIAVVNGVAVTCDDLYELRPEYAEAEIVVNGEMVRSDVTRLVQTEVLLTSAAEEFGVEVTDAEIEERLASPPERWAALLTQERPAGELRLDAVTSLITDEVLPELIMAEYGDLATYVAQRPQDVARVCVRVIVLESEADGIDAFNRVAAGEDFLAVHADVSIDQTNGGLLTINGECPVNVASLGEEFALAVALTPLGQPAGPIPVGAFFGVILVEERVAPDESTDIGTELIEFLDPSSRSTIFSPWASDALREADIEVASAIGRWSPDAFAIAPPGVNAPRG